MHRPLKFLLIFMQWVDILDQRLLLIINILLPTILGQQKQQCDQGKDK